MLLRRWRIRKGMNLARGAQFLGLKSAGGLCDIELGKVFPSPHTITTVQGATGGEVNALDHIAAWRRANPPRFSKLLEAGRASAKTYRAAAAKPKESRDGGKSNSRRR